MKIPTILITFFVVFVSVSAVAQDTIWFDAKWEVTTKDNASFYRPTPKKMDNGYYLIKDYFINGQIQMEGFSSVNSIKNLIFNGKVTYYFDNGQPSAIVSFKNGKHHGERKSYYKAGQLKVHSRYKSGKRDGIWKFFYKNGKIKKKGKYKNGKKVGIWKYFYKNN